MKRSELNDEAKTRLNYSRKLVWRKIKNREKEVTSMSDLTKEGLRYITGRLLKEAVEATEESREDKTDLFKAGRATAYYEMLDILKTELDIRDEDLHEYGLNINLERALI